MEFKISDVSFLLCLNQSVERKAVMARAEIITKLSVPAYDNRIMQYLLSPVYIVHSAFPFYEVLLPFLVSRRKVVTPTSFHSTHWFIYLDA